MNLNFFEDTDRFIMRDPDAPLMRPDNNRPLNSGETARFPQNTPLGMAYVPYQQWGQVSDESEALTKGTLFPELDFPFTGGASK